MTNNSTKLLFLSTLMMGTILSISSNSWFGVWMGLEINLLSFIPLLTSNKNMMMNESSIKYFIVQAMASTMLLFSILLIQMKYPMGWETEFIPSMMISSSLLLKIGAAPFHFWFPEVMGASSWNNCLTLMTWQKIAPMMVLSYCIQLSTFIWTIIILSIIIGAMGGLNQTSLRQLLAYSSISHLGWMISSLTVSENIWELYFIIYSLLSLIMVLLFKQMNLFFMNQIYSASNMLFIAYTNLNMLNGHLIETIWTALPAITLIFIALPSLRLLYLLDDSVDAMITVKTIGRQWYWSCEYSDFMDVEFDTYMTPEQDLENDGFRLLDVDNSTILPMNTEVRVLTSASDVLHSWAVPALGDKIDATPGRLNQGTFTMNRPGLFFGQCSEICGANHSYMPIVIESTSVNLFIKWLSKMI